MLMQPRGTLELRQLSAPGACACARPLPRRRLGHLSWVSATAVCGFLFSAAVILYQGATIALERTTPLEVGAQ